MHFSFPTNQGQSSGFSIISISIIIGLMLASGFALMSYTLSSGRVTKLYTSDVATIQIADAGISKAIFCMNADSGENCGDTYGSLYTGESNVVFNEGEYSVTVSGVGSGRTITAIGQDATGNTKTISTNVTNVPTTDDPDFSFALQAGEGGAYLNNNSTIVGTIYANGDIECQSTNAEIDGDAFSSKSGGMVDSCKVNYHAYADNIIGSKIDGDAHYDTNISGSNVKGDKYPGSPTPLAKGLPDVDLDFWKTSATEGGIIYSDYYPTDGESLGPKKIDGDLIFNNNVEITLTGPIWVTGDITLLNRSAITLDSSFGEYGTIILANSESDKATYGKVDMVNGSSVHGSGNPKSHILIASTNTSLNPSSPALNISNNADGAVFLAADGMMVLNNNANAKSMAAYKLYLENNAEVTYSESELSGMKFSNSPGGNWRVLKGTWTELN